MVAEGRELPGEGAHWRGVSCLEGGKGEGREGHTAASFNTIIHELIESVGEGEGGWRNYAHNCIKPTVSGTVSPKLPPDDLPATGTASSLSDSEKPHTRER